MARVIPERRSRRPTCLVIPLTVTAAALLVGGEPGMWHRAGVLAGS